MKTRAIVIAFAALLAVSFGIGALGFSPLRDEGTAEGEGRLIGLFVTDEYLDLFDADAALEGVSIKDGSIALDTPTGQERLYAVMHTVERTDEETGERVEHREYAFEGASGIAYFAAIYDDGKDGYFSFANDDVIADGHTAIDTSDEGESISMQGTLYVSADKGPTAFYYNPVYQTEQGDVYVVTGQGMSFGGDMVLGQSSSYRIEESKNSTQNGETSAYSASVELTICYMGTPVGVSVLQMDENSGVLSREDYANGELPSTITTEPATAYILVETRFAGGNGAPDASWQLFQPGDESLFAFTSLENGICTKQYASIDWPD